MNESDYQLPIVSLATRDRFSFDCPPSSMYAYMNTYINMHSEETQNDCCDSDSCL
jgi:hypothetical protein